MTNYNLIGTLMDDEKEVELRGNLKADDGGISLERRCQITGKMSENMPRAVKPEITGHAMLYNDTTILYFVQRASDDNMPRLFALTRPSEEITLNGVYRGVWTPLAEELAKELPDDPTTQEIKELLNESREKYSTKVQRGEVTLSMGKVSRVINYVKVRMDEAAEALVPVPQPIPVPVGKYR